MTELSRRNFLIGTGAVATAAVLPAIPLDKVILDVGARCDSGTVIVDIETYGHETLQSLYSMMENRMLSVAYVRKVIGLEDEVITREVKSFEMAYANVGSEGEWWR